LNGLVVGPPASFFQYKIDNFLPPLIHLEVPNRNHGDQIGIIFAIFVLFP
jgi:hypothetical protein